MGTVIAPKTQKCAQKASEYEQEMPPLQATDQPTGFRVISAHIKIGPYQFRPMSISAHSNFGP